MRQGPNSRRSRGRGNNGGGGGGGGGNGGGGGGGNANRRQNVPLRHQNFDSNGPDVRIRGNAWQVQEKYQTLARDAMTAGDRVQAENYLQHAEHYLRITNQIQESENRQRGGQPQPNGGHTSVPGPVQSFDEDESQQPDEDEADDAEERAAVNA
ncbi:DUF4167 domain-containing protein [Azospirillum doebereinerae]|uniref:DUF4167 domain-containing protein n=1 Tax=Azospirillum doebereinerae TaxID=92933 RepID=A0A3S0UYQ3_9PROT|nr:DUF4167 domain-containing protein [Azospirillum doebereinerae]MCG5243055.1 DUF4167 domain-containing protein [Azospirillum doebereinerae]RUQ65905.1 DUF4167 domain-containing protein [Azospirillum doebereinerae]